VLQAAAGEISSFWWGHLFWSQLYKRWGFVTFFRWTVKYSYFGMFGNSMVILASAFMKNTNYGVWAFGMIGWFVGARSFWGLRPQVLEYIEMNEEYKLYEHEEDY